VLLPQGARQRRAELEELEQPFDEARRELEEEVDRDHRREKRERRHDHDTTGIATALASGPAIETWPKRSSTAGASPTVIAHCTRTHCATRDSRPVQPARHRR
jgi:hypothetical protein